MVVIDYPDSQVMRPSKRGPSNTMHLNKYLAMEGSEVTIRTGGGSTPPSISCHPHLIDNEAALHHHHYSPHLNHLLQSAQHQHDSTCLPDLVRGVVSRGSVGSSIRDGSDTSSAYSGSDTMCHSLHSSIETDEMDLTGLTESNVDSDEEDLAFNMESMTVRDTVRECLEKDPNDRTEGDLEVLLEFTQRLKAFYNMTHPVRRAMCQAMVFAVVEEAGTVLMNDHEELDSWSVIINGQVEVIHSDGTVHELNLGESFGITPTMEKLYHNGVMRSKVPDCQFVCIRQNDYYSILHKGEENTRRHEENGKLVLVTEARHIEACHKKGNIVIMGTPERLMSQLIEVENNVDPTYVEDFLLTHRTFIKNPMEVASKLLEWFENPELQDRVTRVVLLWVNNHFTDFEMDPVMIDFLEKFEERLDRMDMGGQLRLLDFACATKARPRTVILTRSSKDASLNFSIQGGNNSVIFICHVEKGSRAEEVGLKRGDQILEINNEDFEHGKVEKAQEKLNSSCHLAITVKSNLLVFKEMLKTPEGSPRMPRKSGSSRDSLSINADFMSSLNLSSSLHQPATHNRKNGHRNNSLTAFLNKPNRANVIKNVFQKIRPKNSNVESQANSDESVSSHSSLGRNLYHSHSNPDLSTTSFDEIRSDFPEHCLKVFRATDQSSRLLPVHKETTAREVVMLALQTFNINDPSGSHNYALYEVTVNEGGVMKQRRLNDNLQNLAERIGLNSRYYLKNVTSQTLIPDENINELIRESQVSFLQLNSVCVAIQLTLDDFAIFRQIEATEYIDHLFNLKSNYGLPALTKFEDLANKEMFWVVTEVCSENNILKRSKIIKHFIKIARHCKDYKNFNSMFNLLSGLGHTAVDRLRLTWEKVPQKYKKSLHDMQNYMDPSRNMSKYRELVNSENNHPPIIPFFPVVSKDLTFARDGNEDKADGLIYFEKLRLISRCIRDLQNMCSVPYDLFMMLEAGGEPQSTAMIAMNQMTTGGQQVATVKRRKKSTAAHDKKKMFEEAQMVRRVKAYLANLKVKTDEDELMTLSHECEAGATGLASKPLGNGGSCSAPSTSSQPRKRHQSPTPSTTSTASSTSHSSEDKRPQQLKFGAQSHQSVEKIRSLAEPTTKPHRPGHRTKSSSTSSSHHSLSPSPSPGSPRRGGAVFVANNIRQSHERSRSDTPNVCVDLCRESSSVTSLTTLHKSHTSASMAADYHGNNQGETDSGISTHYDYHSSSSMEVGGYDPTFLPPSPPMHNHRFSQLPSIVGPLSHHSNLNGQCYRSKSTKYRIPQGRAVSHDEVQYYRARSQDDDEETQVSAV